jgi:hypothetical protein
MKIPYYAHGWSHTKAAYNDNAKSRCTGPVRVLANILEPLIWEKVLEVLSEPERAQAILAKAHALHSKQDKAADMEKLKSKIANVDAQLESLAEHLANMPRGVSPVAIYAQMKKMEESKELLRQEILELEAADEDLALPVDLGTYLAFSQALKNGLHKLGESAKADIIQHMVSKVEILPDAICIHFRVGKSDVRVPEFGSLGSNENKNATSHGSLSLASGDPAQNKNMTFYKYRGSTTLRNGDPNGNRTRVTAVKGQCPNR